MYKNTKTGEIVSLEDAESAAFLANMSLDGWLNFYNFVEEGKEQGSAQPPMMGPQPEGGDSNLDAGSSALPVPSSYLIETGQKKSKRQIRAEESKAVYEQEEMAAFNPSALDPRLQQPETQEGTSIDIGVDDRYAGLGLPTLIEQDEFEIEERDLDIEDPQSTNLFINPSIYNQETGEFERSNDLVKKYYSSVNRTVDKSTGEKRAIASGLITEVGVRAVSGKSAFDDKEFSKEVYATLQENGLSADNFEGFLRRDPLAQEYFERIKRGDFEFDELAPVQSRFVAFKPTVTTGLSPTEEKRLTEQRILRDLLERYVETVNEHANRRAFSKDLRANPEKYEKFADIDSAYESYVYNNGYGEIIEDASTYTDNRFAELKAFEDQQTKKFLETITDEEENIEGRSGWDVAESIIRNFGIAAQRGMTLDPYIAINSFLGFKGEAAEMRDKKALADMRNSHLNKGTYLVPPSGKILEIDGTEYLLGDDDLLYNLSAELVASSYMDPKEVFAISEKIKAEGQESTYNSTSYKGGAIQAGSVFGALVPQVAGMRGVGMARVGASRAAIKNINSARKSAGMKAINTRARGKNGRFISTKDTFGVKLPFNAVQVDNVLFSSYYGYQNGVEATMEAARNAGFTEDQAYELAENAGRQMALLYAVTAPINPRLPFSKFLGSVNKWLKRPATMQAAINGFRTEGVNGFKRVLTKEFGKEFAKGATRTLSAFISDASKELVQENIQQLGEYTIVNSNINDQAGQEILKQDYSYNDFINTSILSFAVGGLSGSMGSINLPSAQRNKLQNLYIISQDLKGAKARLAASVKNNMMTQAEADNILQSAENFEKHGNKVPGYFAKSPDDLIEYVNLIEQRTQLEEEQAGFDKSLKNANADAIAAVETKIAEIKEKVAAQAIDTEIKNVRKAGVKVKVYESVQKMQDAKDANGNSLFDNTDLQSDGLFIDEDGSIIVNKAVAAKKGAVGVASHELLHRILKSQFGEITGREIEVINDLLDQLPPELKQRMTKRANAEIDGVKVYDIQFDEDGKVSGSDIDEFITFLSDEMAAENVFSLNEPTLRKIGRTITNFLKKVFGYNKEFTDGKQVLDFIRDYRSGIAKGKLSTAAKQKMAKSDKIQSEGKKRSVTPKSLLGDINALVPESVQTQEQFFDRKVFNPIYNDGKLHPSIANYIRSRAVSKEEAQKIIESVGDRLVNFNPEAKRKSGDDKITLGEFIFSNVNFGKLDARKALFEEGQERARIESTDSETAKQVVAKEESTIPVKDKPTYKTLTKRRVLSEDAKSTAEAKVLSNVRVLKSRIDAKVGKNVTVTPLIAEIKKTLGKQLDIDFKKEMGGKKDGQLRKYLLRNKAAILENMTTTWLMTAMPNAVQKQVNGVWTSNWQGQKIDREAVSTDNAGRTSGAELVRRLPKAATRLSDADYLSNVLDASGAPIRGRKESLAKAMAEQYAIEIIRDGVADPDSEIGKAFLDNQTRKGVEVTETTAVELNRQAEQGNVKFSYTPEPGNETIIREELDLGIDAQNKTGAWLKANGISKGLPKFKTKEDVDEYVSDLKQHLFPIMTKSFFFGKQGGSTFTSSSSNIGVKSSKDPLWKYFKEEIAKARDDKNTKFAPETGVNFNMRNFETLFKNEAAVLKAKANGDLAAYNKQVAAVHKAMWQAFNKAIRADKTGEVTRAIAKYLHFSTNHTTHPHRMGAQFIAWSKGFDSKGKDGGKITYEHAMPSITAYLYLLDAAKNGYNFDRAYNAVMANFKMIALDKLADKKLGGVYKTGMPKGWSVLTGNWAQRYFNPLVFSNDGGIDPESIIMIDGRTLGEVTGIKADGTFKTEAGIEFSNFINEEVLQKAKEDISKVEAKPKVKRSVSQDQDLSKEFNNILERKTGVEAFKTFSAVQAQKRGEKKGRFKFFIAPSVDDFRGLVNYAFAGKGKQGEADMKWLEDNLMTPYAKGIAAINGIRQQIKRDFKTAVKAFPKQYQLLNKEIGKTGFTYDQAVRVYLWGKAGIKVPGLSQKDTKILQDAIRENPELMDFADAMLVVARRDTWMEPSEHWSASTLLSDLNSMTEKIGRKKYLEEFIANADAIFTEENLNKIEALYGRAHRDAIVDALYSMKNGTNRNAGGNKQVNAWLNWINGSTGAIMFFNRRSALLQMLSTVNFINYSDNNPLKAAAAFANQKQYWTDWAMIFNSDKLKERRGGLKQDVSSNEIASIANANKNSPQAILARLLQLGFTPTQIADSMAIASGGATFYRNRVNTYLKKGMTQKEAEQQAFLDFSKISDETQQSSDPALVSQVQRSNLGRLVFAFQNTPMQMTRLMKKDALDIINGRGDWRVKVARITYYGAIQNFIFSSLQSALFAMLPGFDDDDEDLTAAELDKKNAKEEAKIARVLNSMLDTLLRGSGVYGAVFSTVKNTIREYNKQEEKGFMSDHAYTVLSLFNISPPISSKARKVHSAIQTRKFEKDEIAARGWGVVADGRLDLGPNWTILGKVLSAAVSVPLDRVVDELTSISEAFDARNKAWQRIALALGWKTWDVGAIEENAEAIKAAAKKERKEAGTKKAKETRAEKEAQEQAFIEEQTKGMDGRQRDIWITNYEIGKKEARRAARNKK